MENVSGEVWKAVEGAAVPSREHFVGDVALLVEALGDDQAPGGVVRVRRLKDVGRERVREERSREKDRRRERV